jgi:phospholipid/cholesterol/gamma-HCH transport system substrate-binding protein
MAADTLAPLPRRLLGLAMLVLILALLGLCVAIYDQVFTPVVQVTAQIDQASNSLLPTAEVRLRGVTVGQVTSINTTGNAAAVAFTLYPSEAKHIPSNVTFRLLPKSLFGERYVELEAPANPSPTPIQTGAVIGKDRSSDALETEQLFNNLLPLLQAVRPADLATTLGALNQALTGRGAKLGDTITLLHQYLSQLNPALPDLIADIRALPQFSDTYTQAAPNLIQGLADLTTTSQTLVERQGQLADLLSTGTYAANDLREFLEEIRGDLINLVYTARPPLDLLARYSPEYVCLFHRLAAAVPLGVRAFGEYTPRPALRVTLTLVGPGRGPYVPHRDEPDYTDERGPRCYNNTPPLPQYPGGPYRDGSYHPPASPPPSSTLPLPPTSLPTPLPTALPTPLPSPLPPPRLPSPPPLPPAPPALPALPLVGLGSNQAGPPDVPANHASADKPQALGAAAPGAVTASAVSVANSAPERELVAGLVADMTGADRAGVPDWSSLLVGPLLRGVEVQVR